MHHEVLDHQPRSPMKVFEMFTRDRDACDQQIFVRCVADELTISKISLYKIISEYFRMKKVCMRWKSKLLTSRRRAHRVDCCEELLKNCSQDPNKLFGRIVTGIRDMDAPLRSTQPTRSKDTEETRRNDSNPTTSHTVD